MRLDFLLVYFLLKASGIHLMTNRQKLWKMAKNLIDKIFILFKEYCFYSLQILFFPI